MERKILNNGMNFLHSSPHYDIQQEMPTPIKFPFVIVINLRQSSDVWTNFVISCVEYDPFIILYKCSKSRITFYVRKRKTKWVMILSWSLVRSINFECRRP
jgi:hypothetical protein